MRTGTRSRSGRFELRVLPPAFVMAVLSPRVSTEAASVTCVSGQVRGRDEISFAPPASVEARTFRCDEPETDFDATEAFSVDNSGECRSQSKYGCASVYRCPCRL